MMSLNQHMKYDYGQDWFSSKNVFVCCKNVAKKWFSQKWDMELTMF